LGHQVAEPVPQNNPGEPQPTNPVDFVAAQRQKAAMLAMNGLDGDADEASRAYDLSRSTNVNPALIHTDTEAFDHKVKTSIASRLVMNDDFLAEYARSHPLSPQISNDDWGQLSKISSLINPWRGVGAPLAAGAEAAREAWSGGEGIIQTSPPPPRYSDSIVGRLGQAIQGATTNVPFDLASDLIRLGMKGTSTVIAGGAGAVGELGKELGFHTAPQTAKDVSEALQDPGFWASMPPMEGVPVGQAISAVMRGLHERFIGPYDKKNIGALDKAGEEVAHSLNVAAPYVEAGRMPPVGVDKHIDGYFAELAKQDADWLKEVDKEIGASSTYTRNPEFFANEFFNLRHPPDMSVSFEGVKKLYGEDGKPEPGDNKLGNVWKGAEQYDHAKDFGGDIDISAVDWAKLKPELRDELRDFVRLRRGGMTVEEAKAQQVEAEKSQPYSLEKTEPSGGMDFFDIKDEKAEKVGEAHVTFDKFDHAANGIPRRATIEDVFTNDFIPTPKDEEGMQAAYEVARNKFGPQRVREMLRDLQQQYPGLQEIRGRRISGARYEGGAAADPERGGKYVSMPISSPALDTVARAAKIEPITSKSYIPGTGTRSFIPDDAEPGELKVRGLNLKSGATFPASQLLEQTDTAHLTGVPKALAQFFGDRMANWSKDINVHVVEEKDMATLFPDKPKTPAFYSEGNVVFRSDVLNGRMPDDLAQQIIHHEMGHAFSLDAMETFPKIKDAVDQVRAETDQYLQRVNPDARDKHDYAFTNHHEFVAEAMSNPDFQNVLAKTPISKDLARKLGLGNEVKSVWEAVRSIVKNLLTQIVGHAPSDTVLDAFFRIGEALEKANKILEKMGEQGPRQMEARAKELEPELPQGGTTRVEDRPLFKTPSTIGMNAKRMENYNKLIEKENQEKIELSKKIAEKGEREQQTAEWKENYDKVKDEVRSELHQRPDVAAERFMRDGITPEGNKVRKIKLDAKALTAEQKKGLPEEFVGEGGANPDDLAPVFGFQSGDELVASLARAKAQQDLEGLTPAASFNQRLKSETERVMRQRYGDLETNVLELAKDQVFSPTTLDRLSEEVLALAEHGGQELTIDKGTLQKLAREKFNSVPIGSHSSDKYIAAAGRAGQVAEDALLEGNASEAFKAKQQQYLAMFYGSEARKLEKVKDQFDKRVPKWQRREPPGIEQADAVWIHQILEQIGLGKRSLQDLDRSKQLTSPYKTMRDYAEGVNGQNELYNTDVNAMPVGQKVAISDFLFTDNYRNEVEKMLPDEFRQVFDSLKSIDHFSRNEKKYTVKGNKEDLENVVNGLVERLKAAVDNQPITDKVQQAKSAGRLTGTWLLNPESWMRRLDLGDTFGPFNQLIIRPITEGQYTLRTLERDFASRWKEVGSGFTDLRKKISNPLFKESDGSPIQMTKANAYAVLQNMGNAAQRAKLIKGWNIDDNLQIGEQKIWNWLRQVGIGPDDLARAQKLGDVFNDAFKHSEHAYTSINGVAPARIDLGKMQTPWGESDEWYHPLIPDPLRHKVNLSVDEMMGESGYYRPSPAAGYTKIRTGAVYPVDLTFDSVPFKLKQILNDAAMRPSVTEVSKIVYNKQFQAAFKRYYGAEYMGALDGWMKDVAGNRSWVPQNMAALDKAVTGLVQNLNTALIGFNLGTVAKHAPTAAAFSIAEVGPINFAKSMSKMIYELPGSREAWNWVMENSEEVANRMRHVEDTLIGQNQEMFKRIGWQGKVANVRDLASWYGHYPVGITDLISAVAMFHAEYRRLGEEHPEMSHGDLLYGANTAVRRTHGSSILSNRPSLMRAGGLWKMVSPFYNFFNNALQRNYELAWQSKLAVQGREVPEMVGFDSKEFKAGVEHIPKIIGGLIVYGIIPSLIEQMVDPLPETQGENKALHWAKVLTQAYPSMIPGVRDIINGLNRNRDPSLGLFGTAMRDVAEPLRTKSWTQSPGQAFQTANRVIGMLTGLTMEPVGRAGRFMINVMHGNEHPQGLGDWARGLNKGTMKEQRR
jgi:hypothetical protein